MGFACPVCGDPQADADHLANHLAFTALLRGGEHESWLDEHVPDWEDRDEDSLGERVVEYAEDTEFPQVFEDTTGECDHAHGGADDRGHAAADRRIPDYRASQGVFAEDASDVLESARELTRRRRENAAAEDRPEDSETE